MEREILKMLALVQLLQESMDEFEDTPLYKREVKQGCNILRRHLDKHFKGIVKVMYEKEPEYSNMLLTGFEETVDMLCALDVDQINLLGNTIKAIREDESNRD